MRPRVGLARSPGRVPELERVDQSWSPRYNRRVAATDIYLIRHGETEWNRAGRWCGVSDPPLTETGRFQARALAEWIRHLPVRAVYASPLSRARDTAAPLADALGVDLRLRRSLVERDFGEWEGLHTDEIRSRWPEPLRLLQEDPSRHSAPGGESCDRVVRRARRALGAIARVHPGEAVAVIGHQSVWRIVLAPLLGLPLRDYYRGLELGNSSVSLVRVEPGGLRVIWHNRLSHLGPC